MGLKEYLMGDTDSKLKEAQATMQQIKQLLASSSFGNKNLTAINQLIAATQAIETSTQLIETAVATASSLIEVALQNVTEVIETAATTLLTTVKAIVEAEQTDES